MKSRVALAALVAMAMGSVHAEIEKLATPTEKGISFSWWPKLTPPKGWQHERDQSIAYRINALSPLGGTFANADTVMYAKAVYKPREPLVNSIASLIEKDKKTFLSENPGLSIRELSPIASGDGKALRVFSFEPKGKGNWERVAYGEEGDFYLVFVLSSRTASGYKKASRDFESMIHGYKEKP